MPRALSFHRDGAAEIHYLANDQLVATGGDMPAIGM